MTGIVHDKYDKSKLWVDLAAGELCHGACRVDRAFHLVG
jgi:hypothetical protein